MWNKPDPNQKLVVAKKPAKWHGVVALVLICAVGGAVAWLMIGDAPKAKSDAKKAGLIKEVKPAIPAKPVVTNVVKKIDPNARPTKVGEVVNGYVKLPSGRIHKRTGVITNSIASRPKAWYEIFSHRCDNTLACYLTMKPGDFIVGDINYRNGRFKKDFLESLKEPIIVTADDSPEHAQLKRDVNATKIELKAALDRGEDIEQIVQDTRDEFKRLYQVQESYRRAFMEQKKECQTEQDVEDLFNACNKVLAEKGIAPIKYGPITKRNFLRAKAAEAAAQTQAPVNNPNTAKEPNK